MADTFDFSVWVMRHPDAAAALAESHCSAFAELQAHSHTAEAKGGPAKIEVETKLVSDQAIIEAKEKEILRRLAVRELEAEAANERRKKRRREEMEARARRFC